MLVSGNFFSVLGVEPELGRTFGEQEDQAPGRDAVLILGHDFWEKELGGDPAILGRKVRLSGIEFTVIGVAPSRFTGINQYLTPTFYVPLNMWPRFVSDPKDKPLEARYWRGLALKGRLKPGVTVEQAQAEMTVIAKALEAAYPDTNKNRSVAVRTEFQNRIQQSPPDAAIAAMLTSAGVGRARSGLRERCGIAFEPRAGSGAGDGAATRHRRRTRPAHPPVDDREPAGSPRRRLARLGPGIRGRGVSRPPAATVRFHVPALHPSGSARARLQPDCLLAERDSVRLGAGLANHSPGSRAARCALPVRTLHTAAACSAAMRWWPRRWRFRWCC